MFSEGFLTINGKTYFWGVRHYKKCHPYNINFGRVEWVAVADDGGTVLRKDTWNYWPEDDFIRTLMMALIERFNKEVEQ